MSFDPRSFIARVEWRHARTVTRFRHWYLVQPREDAEDFLAFTALSEADYH